MYETKPDNLEQTEPMCVNSNLMFANLVNFIYILTPYAKKVYRMRFFCVIVKNNLTLCSDRNQIILVRSGLADGH